MQEHYCHQCGRDMGFEYLLGPVCGRCCRANHAKVAGKLAANRKQPSVQPSRDRRKAIASRKRS